ncbi:MAG: ATPase domain-containing protein [Candidatus Nanohaloarchaea archaeon]|nr:ATPase domain-containing protein [Candidatus Nanohaloarchaea archaeon]
MVERVATGIHGLDDLIQGGIPKHSTLLVAGSAGTGKTLFCCQFLWQGLQEGDNCLFITLEEDEDDILKDAAEFGWDFEEYEDRFEIKYMNPFSVDGAFDDHIRRYIDEVDADRVVIDSTSVMGMYAGGEGEIRRQLYELIKQLKRSDVTTILTAERPSESSISRYGVEEYVTDGAIILKGLGVGGEMGRRLSIQKLRRTDFDQDIYPMEFTENGLKVEEPDTGVSL